MNATQQQIDRAFAIADRAMFERLQGEAVPIDATPTDATSFALTDASYLEVSAFEHASPDLREAVEWLRDRGYVELATDNDGEFVNVLRRPGECVDDVSAPAAGQCLRDGVAESSSKERNGNADWTKAGTGVNSPTSPGSISRKASTGSAGSNPAAVAPHTVDWLGLALDLEAQAKRVESQTVERAMLAAANGLRFMGAHGVLVGDGTGRALPPVSNEERTAPGMLASGQTQQSPHAAGSDALGGGTAFQQRPVSGRIDFPASTRHPVTGVVPRQLDSAVPVDQDASGTGGVEVRYVRKPEADKRVARGDDFAGDAWLDTQTGETVYTVVGFDRNQQPTMIVQDGRAVSTAGAQEVSRG